MMYLSCIFVSNIVNIVYSYNHIWLLFVHDYFVVTKLNLDIVLGLFLEYIGPRAGDIEKVWTHIMAQSFLAKVSFVGTAG